MKKYFSNILIVGHRNIGDIFHNMAVLKPLHLAFPNAKISLLTSETGKTLLEHNPYLSEIFILFKKRNGKMKTLKEQLKLIYLLRQKNFDLTINLKKGSYWAYFLGAPVWSIPSYYKSVKRNVHAIDIYLNLMRQHGIFISSKDLDMRIIPTISEKRHLDEILEKNSYSSFKKTAVIAPFSNWHAKEWNLKNFARLSQTLAERHHIQTIFVGGENDCEKMRKIGGYKNYFMDLVGKISLRQLAALYEKAALAIGGDSGPFHLATNMGVPAIGIFAPTPHERYGPYFSRELTVSCEEDLGCNPCFAGKKLMACGVYNRTTPCMEKITADAVYQSVLKVMDPTGFEPATFALRTRRSPN